MISPAPPALVLHIPHASLVIPGDLAADFLLTPAQLDHELLAMTDRFPTRPSPYEDDQDPDRADICLGTDASHTPAWLRDAAAAAFEALGWSVAIDRPFAGALVPMRFFGKDLRVRALMIEVRRGLYMDEGSGARGPAFDEVRERIGAALRTIGSRPHPGGPVE
jgi:N-formylglutamate amidohydrolase